VFYKVKDFFAIGQPPKSDILKMEAILPLLSGQTTRNGASRGLRAIEPAIIMAAIAGLMLLSVAFGLGTPVGVAASVLLITASGLCVVLVFRGVRATANDIPALVAILEAEISPLVVTDDQGAIVGANNAYRKLFVGRVKTPVTLVDRNLEDYGARETLNKVLETGEDGTFVLFQFSGGRSRPFDVRVSPKGSYLVWHFTDIDPEKSQQEAISWLNTIAKPFFEETAIAVMLFNNDDGLIYSNNASQKFFDFAGSGLKKTSYEQIFGEGGIYQGATAAGRLKYEIVESLLPQDVDSPSVAGRIVMLRECESHPDDDNVRLDTKDLSRILEGAPISIASVGRSGQIKDFNMRFSNDCVALLGMPCAKGDKFEDFVSSYSWPQVHKAILETNDGAPPEYPIDVEVAGSADQSLQMYFGMGSSRGQSTAIIYMVDTTEQKLLEAQFVQAQKMQAVGQLAGGVAHDFNNLLTAIIGFCDLLLVRHGAGDQSFADLMQVKQNAVRGANLVRQLLAFSRRQTLRPKVLDVTDVLAELSNLLRRLIGEKTELKMSHGRNLGAVRVDEGQLEQVVINLAVNARDAMPDGGILSLATRAIMEDECEALGFSLLRPGQYVELTVRDTGCGIPVAFRDKIFEPFFTTKEVGKGTGLGLSTVYGIVKQTGGYIFAGGEEGEGAAFKIYLPVHSEAGQSVAAEQLSSKSQDLNPVVTDLTGKGTILVVEDDAAVRIFTSRALTNKGYTVIEASSGEEALLLIENQSQTIDLLVSDVVMPSMDGPTLAGKARQLRPEIRIVLISGYAQGAFDHSEGETEYEFLAKPFSLNQLAEKVKTILVGRSDS
jgi:two-component system, cell cycle sensor histidine kinase and response regulator CckA